MGQEQGDKMHGKRGWNFMKFVLLILLSSRSLVQVEGNEIESCIRVPHGAKSSGPAGPGHMRLGGSNANSNVHHLFRTEGGSSSLSSNPGSSSQEHATISCQIRTLHPDLDVLNLTSSISPEVDSSSISKLKLECNDVLFFESGVSPGQLSALPELHELTIEKCKLKHLPADFLSGLRHLRRLTINTGNSDWAARSLEISPGAFSQTPRLSSIHLGFNHMWSLPDRLLCQVGSLTSLNLTHNLLSDIDDLGLPGGGRVLPLQNEGLSRTSTSGTPTGGDACLGELKIFDLSFNNLRTLGSGRLAGLKRLENLKVDHNWLEELEDETFTGLSNLHFLNLSSNRLVALPPFIFKGNGALRELDLRNNSLTALAPLHLEQLQLLDLSMNSLSSQWITTEAFKSLVRLVILNLSHNQLTHLTPFNELYSLQVLDLSHNLISSIEDGSFEKLKNLHSLSLSKNRIVAINSNMFNGLYVLHKLILDYNQIDKIEPGAFQNLTSLHDLGLVGNQLAEVPEALRSSLQNLRTLDLGENRISSLNNESFLGMSQLYGLRLVDNKLSEIPKGLCDSTPRLQVFNIGQNQIHKISSSAFHSCPELKILRLDMNRLEAIPDTLAPQLPSLLWLNVSENLIRRADYSQLPASLEWFDASGNQLESLGGAWAKSKGSKASQDSTTQSSALNHNVKLRIVDASHNKLSLLDYHAVPPNLEVLRVNHNRLVKIAPDTFSHSGHLRRVELIGNQLENIPLSALRLPPIPAGRPLPGFYLGGNPLLCDSSMDWLLRINQLSALRQHPTVQDLDAIVCRVAFSRTVTHVPLMDMKPNQFLSEYRSHCFNLCHCCEFDACDCEMVCPTNCSCSHDSGWTANVVNCANSGAKAVPSRLPMDSTEVYLDGNHIPVLKSHTFIGRKNLKILYLNNSFVEKISNKSFNGLSSLTSLHLQNNRLRVLYGYEFDGLTHLRILALHDNLLESISNSTFLHLKSLEILRLDGNKLVTFTVWQLSLNPYLVEIGLSRNEWNCDCLFLHQLYGWVSDNARKVIDLGQLQCYWNTTHRPGPHLMDYNRTCLTSWGLDGGLDFTSVSTLPLIFAFVSTLLLLIIIVIAFMLCKDPARLWLFSKYGLRLCPTYCPDEEKLYDAYFLYSQKDEDFLAHKIADELEANDSYRLCLHYRDLLSESGDLKEMMVGAVENSKSVVVILSRNFLQGEWANGEYRGAFHAVLKKSQKGGRDREGRKVVLIFVDDNMNPMDVSPDIRAWVRTNRIQVIKWSITSPDQKKQNKFWSKLKYSLPPPCSHYNSNITSNTTTATSASSNESNGGGIMATLKYSQGTIKQTNHNQQHNILAEELARNAASGKLWPYGGGGGTFSPTPKYGTTTYSQSPSHLSFGSPHHYMHHPPLPSSNPPKSPPSSQSTDSTTTNNGDEGNGRESAFSLMFQHKSPLPVPKNSVLYNQSSAGSNNNMHNIIGSGGESYLSVEGDHIYSSLDPPSPQALAGSGRLLNNIHLPNGYTYQPQLTYHHQASPQSQWHQGSSLSAANSTPRGTLTYAHAGGNGKGKGLGKDGNPVQTYLV